MRTKMMAASVVLVAGAAAQAQVAKTTFTYQGRLTDGAAAATGNYDLRFELLDSLGGSYGMIDKNNTAVSQGLFTAALDFGSVYDGIASKVRVSVKPAGSVQAYTVLAPDQDLTPSPYSIFSFGPWNVEPAGNGLTYYRNVAIGRGIDPNAGFAVQGGQIYGATFRTTSAGTGAAGVVGAADNATNAIGVFGTSTSPTGTGVAGNAYGNGVSGLNIPNGTAGFLGTSFSGVYGYSPTASTAAGFFRNGVAGGIALFVDGLAQVRTLQIIGGSDLAEPFDVHAAGEIEAGMVVVIDPAHPGELKVSERAYDGAVAGVISGANGLAPGMVMKAEGVDKANGAHPVAMTGRVWVWCDATEGAITPGDRLTTSGTPGHAMRAVDAAKAPGAVIGKAMTELKEGTGLVLVLVNLQ